MDDDVTGVDQHPVTIGQAFNPGRSKALFLQIAQQMVCDGTDMTMRPP